MFDIGLVFGEGSQNRFVLSENEIEEEEEAECIIRISKDIKSFSIPVTKTETVSQMYLRVLQLCLLDDLNVDHFVLTFNSYTIDATAELVKVCQTLYKIYSFANLYLKNIV
jgi:hypothetical protein